MKGARKKIRNLKQRGLDLLSAGRIVEARDAFLRACEQGGTDPEAWYHLGMINGRLGILNGVEPCLRQAVNLAPEFTEAALRLGEALAYIGKLDESITVLRQLLATRPTLVDAWLKLGNALEASGEHNKAIECYERVIALDPGHDVACTSVGNARYFIGDFDNAMRAYTRATELNPANLKAALGRHLSLPMIYHDRAHMLNARKRYQDGVASLVAQTERFKGAQNLVEQLQWSYNFYLAYQGMDDKPLQQAFGNFFATLAQCAMPQFTNPLPRNSAGNRRLRVGYASHFFHNHTVSYYFNNWIHHADRDRFETFVYHINPVIDETSRALATACTHYRPLAYALAAIADVIRQDRLDVLVYPEVGMYSKDMWLAALRLAPVQCAAWGHPVTTGLPTIDYALSAKAVEPDDAATHYSENLVRLDGIGACVNAPTIDGVGTREQYGLPADRNIYLCSQSLFKNHVDMDEVMAAVAMRDPRALIVLFEDAKSLVTDAYRRRLGAAFALQGLEIDAHVRFLPRMQHRDFLRVNQLADVMIDTPHWSGGRTSLDALGVGLPIVAFEGRYSRGRQTAGMLKMIGMSDLIAPDVETYAAKAVEISTDRERRKRVSEDIMARTSGVLFDDVATVRSLERFFLEAVSQGSL